MTKNHDEPHTPAPELPDDFHLPPRKTLLKATGIAAGVAALVLLLFILPAEYGVDPTGFGGLMGIDGIAAPGDGGTHVAEDEPFRTDTVDIIVPARSGLEYKFAMGDGSALLYSWNATGDLYYDFHGEPTDGPSGYFESYEEDTQAGADGSFRAPFDGTHGWYWYNSGTSAVTVTLHTSGHYDVVGLR